MNKFFRSPGQWSWLSVSLVLLVVAAWLRLNGLTQVPPAPYWDEVSLAYDAYSIAETGKDHHGTAWPIVAFESFGDWKPSGYFYAAAASVKVFGFSLWAVRLPAALAGLSLVGLIGVSGFLAWRWGGIGGRWLGVILLGLAAISPWGILFSRAAWEVMLATFLAVAGIVTLWWSLQSWAKRSRWWLVAAGLSLGYAVLSMYTYHALRLVTPLLYGWTLLCWLSQQPRQQLKQAFVTQLRQTLAGSMILGGVALLCLWPLLSNLQSPTVKHRFAETSIFNSLAPITASNTAQAATDHAWWSRLVYHRYLYQLELVGQQYLKHLNLNFLFIHGDANPRHSSQSFGQLYYLDAILILIGAIQLWRRHRGWAVYLAGWWLIATLPAALTTAAPHALRSLPAWPVWIWLAGYGFWYVTQHWRLVLLGLVPAYALSLIWFWSAYTSVYPKVYAGEWQAGYCEMYQALSQQIAAYPELPVYVTRQRGRPAMYYWYCERIAPERVQAANATAAKDQSEFLEFERLKFVGSVNEVPQTPALVAADSQETIPSTVTPHILYQSASWQMWRQ